MILHAVAVGRGKADREEKGGRKGEGHTKAKGTSAGVVIVPLGVKMTIVPISRREFVRFSKR